MKGNIITFIIALLSISISSLFSTLMPVVIKITIDSIIGNKPFGLPSWVIGLVERIGGKSVLYKNLWICGLILVALTIGQGIFLYLKGRLASVASENSGKRLRERVYDHIMHLPYDYHVKSQAGDLIQRCTSDVETIQSFISSQLVETGQNVITFSLVFAMMLSMSPLYSLISIALMPIVFIITITFFLSMKKTFKLTDEAEARMSSSLQENLVGIRVVKAFGSQKLESEKFDEKNSDYKRSVYRIIILMSNFWSSTDLLCLIQLCIVIFFGVYGVNTGSITLGTMVAFTTFSGMLIWPVRSLGQILAFMGQAFVSLTRVQEILDHPLELPSCAETFPDIKGDIEFQNVLFEYNEGTPILEDFSMKIGKGQTVAILGATGSGKSSLIHLLVRLYDYQMGSIKIDGVELKEIDRKWLRKHIGIALQEPFLFSKTILENIRFGKLNAHENEIHASSSIAAIHDSILEFEKGYDTIVGERGVTLSGGQRQRLAIARAVLRNVPILIFDDSLSAVDMETDAAIRSALRKKSKHTTTIIISHRITTLAEADVIFVLEDGRIKQSGTHQDLISQEGLYKRVWEIQNSVDSDFEVV
jgi:ATP-binding cassette subfamily B protein